MIRKMPNGRWQVYGRRNGKKHYLGTVDSEREAKSVERRDLVEEEQRAAGELPPEVDTRRTLQVATDAWLEALKASKSRSHRPYSEFIKYQVLPTLAGVPIAKFTRQRIVEWRDSLLAKYAPTSINAALACLSSAFTWFVEREWLSANPCLGVAQVEVAPRTYNWIKTRPELERLLLASADELRDMIAVAVATGLRLDEMLHLAWDDVDLANRLLTIQRGRQGTVKGGRIRHVPIVDSVLAVFKQRALRRAGATFVFPGAGGAVRAKTPVQCAYKLALKRAGLDTSLRWHDLRHTMASWWVMSGGDIFRLSRILGHANVTITQRTYAHLAPEAWQQDYHRVAFHVPSEPAKIVAFERDENGKLAGRRSVTLAEVAADQGDERETSPISLAK